MNKSYLIKKLAELNVRTELVMHKKLSKIITNSSNDRDNLNSNDGNKIYFDIDTDQIKELLNNTDVEKVKIPPLSLG